MADEIKLPREMALALGKMLTEGLEPKTEIYFDKGYFDRVWLKLEDGKLKVSTSGTCISEMVFNPAKTKISFGKPDTIWGRGSSYIEVSSGRKTFKSDVTSLYLCPDLEWQHFKSHMQWLDGEDGYIGHETYEAFKEQYLKYEDDGDNEVCMFQFYNHDTDEETFLGENYAQCIKLLRRQDIHTVTHNDFKAFIDAGVDV